MSDEDIISTLAYTKSPKFCKRTTFQEELHEALYARAARQQTAEYSEDFESDSGGSEEEFPETVENTSEKSVAFAMPLSKFKRCDGNTLKSESADYFSSSEEDERPPCVPMVKGEVIKEERQDVPFPLIECSESEGKTTKKSFPFETSLQDHLVENEIADYLMLADDEERLKERTGSEKKHPSRGMQEDDSVAEKGSGIEGEDNQQNEATVFEMQLEKEDTIQYKTKIKPVPKPREFKTKAASASAENVSIPALSDALKPSPQSRSVLRRNCHVEDHEGGKGEDRASYSHKFFSLSAPSSKTRLNDQVIKSEMRALSESPGAEGPWLASSSSPFPIHFSSMDERTGDSNLTIYGEEPSLKAEEDKETDACSDLNLPESGRKSPSVIELMMTTVYEKAKKRNTSAEETLEDSAAVDRSNETTSVDKFEEKAALNSSKATLGTSKEAAKKGSEENEAGPQKAKSSINRSLSSTYLRKTGKSSHIPTSTSSQYLGTLKFLDNKHLQKYSAELDKADSLRAAVYQDWLEKKRIFLLELQRIKRNKAEGLRDKNEKKEAAKREEALASFEAWKAMKEKEAKKLAEKKRLEEAKKRKEEELSDRKKEEAQKAAFDKWKEKKAEYLKQQMKREKRAEQLKKKKEEEIIAEKKKDNRSAVEKWNEKKEEFMKQQRKEKTKERKKVEEQYVEREEKDKKAIEAYEKWLENKELNEMIQRKQKNLHVIFEDEIPPPWSPPGKALSTSY